MSKKNVQTKRREDNNGVANPVGLFIQYWKERGWKQISSTKLAAPNKPHCVGDCIVIEYVRGVSSMYHCADGEAHVISYNECPLPQATLKWLAKVNKPKPKAKRRYRGKKNSAMANALRAANKRG